MNVGDYGQVMRGLYGNAAANANAKIKAGAAANAARRALMEAEGLRIENGCLVSHPELAESSEVIAKLQREYDAAQKY